ncbi:MAG: hypothetical protein LBE38_00800 [Deltaproteobacteria bacterium]|jgi:hypothetical protein|nr:hypothetical protein [Deltaproteobacteria bacterium]
MYIFDNPFFVLEANALDDRSKIIELSDERSLILDPSMCTEARSNLTIPNKRIRSEISWFPGAPFDIVTQLLKHFPIESDPTIDSKTTKLLETLNPISRANFFASYLHFLTLIDYTNFTKIKNELVNKIIVNLAKDYENIKIDDILFYINHDRSVSKFPLIQDKQLLEEMLKEQRTFYRSSISGFLDKLEPISLVKSIQKIIDVATKDGNNITPLLIGDIIDIYEISTQEFNQLEKANIIYFVQKIRDSISKSKSDNYTDSIVKILNKVCNNWLFVVKPLHIYSKSKGIVHNNSIEICNILRNLSLELSNKHKKFDISLKIIKFLANSFQHIAEISEGLKNDMIILEGMANPTRLHILDQLRNTDNFASEIKYEVFIGTIFRNKFSIDPQGISWKNKYIPLEKISGVSWGGTVTNNFIGTTTHELSISLKCDDNRIITIQVNDLEIFRNITLRIQRSIGISIISIYLDALRKGNIFKFENMILSDEGVTINKFAFFGKDETFYPWNNLVSKSSDGFFTLFSKSKRNTPLINLSYISTYNIVLLEPLINIAIQKQIRKLSETLQ